jgi:hypothetical protein
LIAVNVNFSGHKQFQRTLSSLNVSVNKKTQQALNRTLQRARTQMTNAVGDKLNLKKRTIRELIHIQRATKITGLIGSLTVKNKPVPLIEYKAKQNRKGVSFKVFKGRSRQLIKHAFVTTDSHNRQTVFKREGEARLKIKPLYGTRVTDVAIDKIRKINYFSVVFFKSEVSKLYALKSGN